MIPHGVYYTIDPSTASQFIFTGVSTASIRQVSWQASMSLFLHFSHTNKISDPGTIFRIGTSCGKFHKYMIIK